MSSFLQRTSRAVSRSHFPCNMYIPMHPGRRSTGVFSSRHAKRGVRRAAEDTVGAPSVNSLSSHGPATTPASTPHHRRSRLGSLCFSSIVLCKRKSHTRCICSSLPFLLCFNKHLHISILGSWLFPPANPLCISCLGFVFSLFCRLFVSYECVVMYARACL